MAARENNYNLTERVVAVLAAKGDVTVGAKALRISQLQSGVAAAFALPARGARGGRAARRAGGGAEGGRCASRR